MAGGVQGGAAEGPPWRGFGGGAPKSWRNWSYIGATSLRKNDVWTWICPNERKAALAI
jgi:hypothetical protein